MTWLSAKIISISTWSKLKDLPLQLIVLAPSAETAHHRGAQRDKNLEDGWSFLDTALRTELSGQGFWLDTSELTPEQTVQTIRTLN